MCNTAGNIFRNRDMGLLYLWPHETCDDILYKVENQYARNLISLLLSSEPSARIRPSKIKQRAFILNEIRARQFNCDGSQFDVYISVRAAADLEHALKIREVLVSKGLKVWLDERPVDTSNWLSSFMDGLIHSHNVLCILSRGSINSERKEGFNFCTLDLKSELDPLFLEWLMILELFNRKWISSIYPVMIGDLDCCENEGTSTVQYGDYVKTNCHPLKCRNTHVLSVEIEFRQILKSKVLFR